MIKKIRKIVLKQLQDTFIGDLYFFGEWLKDLKEGKIFKCLFEISVFLQLRLIENYLFKFLINLLINIINEFFTTKN